MDTRYVKAEVKNKDGKIEGIASTSVLDRQNESVNVDGWDLKAFKKNPLLLWAHDHSEPAIGKVTKVKVEGEGKKRSLLFEAVFQEVTEKAKAVKQLVEDGFISAFSVGFRPLEMEGDEIIKQELLEISVVNVPANPEAMLLAYKSLRKEGFDTKTITKVLDDEIIKRFAEIDARIDEIDNKAELAVKGLKHLNPQRSKDETTKNRLNALKVIARASDKMLVEKSGDINTVKVIKRSSEILIRSHKGELHGKVERTSR